MFQEPQDLSRSLHKRTTPYSSNSRKESLKRRSGRVNRPRSATLGVVGSTSTSDDFGEVFEDELDMGLGDGVTVVSVVETRGREVCFCSINTSNLSCLRVLHMIDNHSYAESINTLQELEPNEILLHDGRREGILTNKIKQTFSESSVTILFMSRQLFDQDKGASKLENVLVGSVDQDLVAKYGILSGSYCILQYIENVSGCEFSHHSIRLEHYLTTSISKRMIIDRHTALNLELIMNSLNGDYKESLFGMINSTKTSVGSRLLRSQILRPSTDLTTIISRHDALDILIKHPARYQALYNQFLNQLPDIDRMLSGLNVKPKDKTDKTVRQGIDTLIYIRSCLRTAPLIAGEINRLMAEHGSSIRIGESNQHSNGIHIHDNTTKYNLLKLIHGSIANPKFNEITSLLDEWLSESTEYSKNAQEMRHQSCFALRAGRNALLDVSRATFQQCIEDMYRLGDIYSDQLECQVKLLYSTQRGYYLSIPIHAVDILPEMFLQCIVNKRSIFCTTQELCSLSDRAKESISTALYLSYDLIQNVMDNIRAYMNDLFLFADGIAYIDMLCSFSWLVYDAVQPYCRPLMYESDDYENSSLIIKEGRHDIVAKLQKLGPSFVPNDCIIHQDKPLHIITGANGAGKSTYMKQVAIIIIMAQIGCYVPARYAAIPIRDRIFSRLGTGDDMEHNMSTFLKEMKETSSILQRATPQSLVIIDELGRATSYRDGVAIAYAVAEKLLKLKCFTLFVTHFPSLTKLEDMYASVQNTHLSSPTILPSQYSHQQLPVRENFNHSLKNGSCDSNNGYGIDMAERCGLPLHIINRARNLLPRAHEVLPHLIINKRDKTLEIFQFIVKTLKTIAIESEGNGLDLDATRQHLITLQSKINPAMHSALIKHITHRRAMAQAQVKLEVQHEDELQDQNGQQENYVYDSDREKQSTKMPNMLDEDNHTSRDNSYPTSPIQGVEKVEKKSAPHVDTAMAVSLAPLLSAQSMIPDLPSQSEIRTKLSSDTLLTP
jgi:DNA mismatch repair protein MSH4